MNVVNAIIKYWDVIVTIAFFSVALLGAYKNKSLEGIKEQLFAVITNAESQYGPGMGLVKYSQVAEFIYSHIPTTLQLIVSRNDIERLIEKALDDARGKWAQSSDLQHYIELNNEVPVNEKKE